MKAPFRAKSILKATVMAGASLISVVAPIVMEAHPAFAAPTVPPWEQDPQARGNLAFFDASGTLLTGGTDLTHLFDYAAATTGPTAGSTKATLYFAAPNSTKPTSGWTVAQASTSQTFPDSSYPAPLTGPGFANPVIHAQVANDDADLTGLVGGFVLDTSSNYDHMIQVRLKDTNSGTKYWESDIAYNDTANPLTTNGVTVQPGDWALVYPQPSPTTTTAVTAISNGTYGTPVTYTATVSPGPAGGTVAFKDNGTTIPSCSAQPVDEGTGVATCTVTPTAGSHSITADYSGSLYDGASSSSGSPQIFTVSKANTTVTLVSDSTTANVGDPVTYTATVTVPAGTPTGTVAFDDGSGNPATTNCALQPVTANVATCQVTYTNAGSYSVTATYSGDTNFNASPASNTVSETINPTATSTTVSASSNPAAEGVPVDITATIIPTPDGGTVTFTEGATTLCNAVPVTSGQAVCTYTFTTGGTHNIVATYSGTSNFSGSDNSSSPYALAVKTATTTVLSPTTASVTGEDVTYTATVSGAGGTPTGNVTFTDGAGNPATVNCASQALDGSGVATCTVPYSSAGAYTVNATYNGDTTYAGSSASPVTQTVNPADTSTAITVTPGATTVVGQAVTYTATVNVTSPGSGTPTGTVTFTDGANNPATMNCVSKTLSGNTATCTVTYTTAQPYTVNATYTNVDGNFNGSSATPVTQTVNPAATTTTLAASATSILTGQSVTYTATVHVTSPGSGTPTGSVSFTDGSGNPATTNCASKTLSGNTATCTVTYPTAGSYTVSATYTNVDGNFVSSTSSNQTETVTAPTAPSAPTGLTALPGNGQVTLAWAAPASDGHSAITGYNVYVGTSPGGESATPAATTGAKTYTVTGLTNGTKYYFVVKAVNAIGSSSPSNEASATPAVGEGYFLVGQDGGVFSFGSAQFRGSLGGLHLAAPIVGMVMTPDKGGYWLVGSDGGVFSFGDAHFYGSMGGIHLARPVVGIASTPSGHGYWLVGSDGGVFSFGDAHFYGSMGGIHLARPVVGIVASHSGHGYLLAAADGGVFGFGDAPFRGSLGGVHLAQPITGITLTPSGNGYLMVAADGGVFAFGDARFSGSLAGFRLAAPVIAILLSSDGNGYWLIGSDGGVFSFGDARFHGSLGSLGIPAGHVVGGAAS